jgi:heterodisulfide reductase subunit C
MKYELSEENCRWQFIQSIETLSGQNISVCYQCGKCSASCPLCKDMEAKPNQIVRYIQLGLKDRALINNTIWLCAGCQTCSIMCPQKLDLARVMASLRSIHNQEVMRQKLPLTLSVKEFGQRIYRSLFSRLQRGVVRMREKRAEEREKRAEGREERAEEMEKRAEGREERAEGREKRAEEMEERAGKREKRAGKEVDVKVAGQAAAAVEVDVKANRKANVKAGREAEVGVVRNLAVAVDAVAVDVEEDADIKVIEKVINVEE